MNRAVWSVCVKRRLLRAWRGGGAAALEDQRREVSRVLRVQVRLATRTRMVVVIMIMMMMVMMMK